MSDERRHEEPRTIGELRARLERLGNPWSVDPRLADEEPIPDLPRGGLEPGQGPAEVEPPAPFEGDLERMLSESPPTNPLLRRRWAEAGLLEPTDGEPGGSAGPLAKGDSA